ncbi:putative disease resistance RPP13-like protein 1 [Bidens hawaiensis]|uniref:putative disease resistance RPP13-like protein 1 n=1 Tax=Bidens hawaiensis TaxID=980011 RepID=UPI00404A99B6
MAEIVASALLDAVFEKLTSLTLNKFASSQGTHSELNKLGRKLSQIRALLYDASRKEISDEAVKQWLNSLQNLAYDIDDVLDELATEAIHLELTQESGAIISKVRKLISTCFTKFSLSHRLHHKLDDITTKLQDLEKENLALGLTVKDEKPKSRSRSICRKTETSLPDASIIVGRDADKEKMLKKLFENEPCNKKIGVVPIVGMGGVGKTTLARLLYNETRVKDHFELRAWVCVSDEFDIIKISETIYESVTRENKEFKDLNQLQMSLVEKLKEKRFLLVLDDVWSENYDDWENLVRPFYSGARGSKIIMTTRKEKLLKNLEFDHLEHLNSLSHDDALSLFSQHALCVDNFASHPTLRPQGEGIVKKCGGLPLALKALGRLLRTKTDEEDWDDVLNSEIWDADNGDDIVPALRLSYHDLPACLKQLFAYCSMFPKGFVFDKEELVLLWMAEGFLSHSATRKSAERLGYKYFEELLSRSFFQPIPNEKPLFMMHDLLNDLATFVAKDYFMRYDNHMEMGKEALEKYRHMSFIREKYVAYQKFEVFKRAKNLRTFIAVSVEAKESVYLSSKILVNLLPELPLLRVLCLSYFYITEVPEFIGSLKHLRYLNFSHTQIKELPENVGNLYNLQTLIVCWCLRLTKLPNTFLKLKGLRHFDMRSTPLLKRMPFGIGDLKNLQSLTNIIIGGDGCFSLAELKELKNLRGKMSIKGLDKVQNAMLAREANLSQKRLAELKLEWDTVFDGFRNTTLDFEVLNELKPPSDKLKRLQIECYGGIKFPNWFGDPLFLQLVHVSLIGCGKCSSLPPLGQLPSLKELFIQQMDNVTFVGLELLGTTGVAFPSLEVLYIEDMQRWEAWSTSHEVVDVVFPCLRGLVIINCPALGEVSLEALPSLSMLEIVDCDNGLLRSLVQAASLITKLHIVSISGLTDELWRGVTKLLRAVEEVRIDRCHEIRYLLESKPEATKVLVNLRKFQVWNCESFVSLSEKEDNFGSNLPISLRNLSIGCCESMEHCSCPNSIEELSIYSCSSIACISFPIAGGGFNLKSLFINNCNKLMEKINITSMPMLEFVNIRCWPNLKSVPDLNSLVHLAQLRIHGCPSIESFHDIQLPNLTHMVIESCESMESFPALHFPKLTHLTIEDCQSMESFPDIQLPNLTSLKYMKIKNCPNMDASFPRGRWPPKLCTLHIGMLKKPILEWGPQNFPSSLHDLELFGEHARNISELSDLLPSSLTSLGINDFEKLESLSMGLQHLTSLQHLSFWNCPNMMHLPEMLLPSLLSLNINLCPNLEKRTRRTYYWPLISHIPCVNINYQLL